MKKDGCIIYLTTIVALVAYLILPRLMTEIFGDGWSYWQVVSLLFGAIALIFIGWYLFMYKVKNPSLTKLDSMQTNVKADQRPSFKFNKLFYGLLFWAILFSTVSSCSYFISDDIQAENAAQRVWNADNIPLPHLSDGRLYVSNPDSVLRQETVDSMNVILFELDKKVGIESAVIIVNHVENQDPFRMAQDVGNKYGIGKKATDRGLVIVVAYEDRKYFIAPGRGLEGDLTDAECSRLARSYLTPYMREYNPDGGMLSLVKATYALTVEKRELSMPTDEDLTVGRTEEETDLPLSFSILILMALGLIYTNLNNKYKWINIQNNGTGYTGYGRSRMGGGYGSWGSSWGGGGFRGGYGGGSFGGGGAGGGW